MGNQQARQECIFNIPDLEGYFISNIGDVYSVKQSNIPRKLKTHYHYGRSKNPYIRCKLGDKLFLVHRLSAACILGRQLNKNEFVNRKNGVTTDNRFENLEVVTHEENVKHAVMNNLYCKGVDWHNARENKFL